MRKFWINFMGSLSSIDNKEFQFNIDYWLLIICILFWRFPIALGLRDNLLFRFLLLFPFVVQIIIKVIYFYRTGSSFLLDKPFLIIFFLYIGIWILGFIRTISYKITFDSFYLGEYLITLIVLGSFLFLIFAYHTDTNNRKRLLRGLLYAFGIFVSINLILYVFGGKSVELTYLAKYPAQMLSIIGISTNRVMFPMADGINSFGIFSGAVLVGLIPLWSSRSNSISKLIIGTGILSCTCIILLSDSRGAIVYSFLTIFLMIIPPKLFKILRWSPFLISFLPILLLILFPSLLKQNINLFDRPDTQWNENNSLTISTQACLDNLQNSGGFLSNRPVIWEMVIKELTPFKIQQLIGFGVRGQVVSSISSSYSCLFSSFVHATLASAHNSWLQIILDVGYLGLGIILIFLVLIIKNLSIRYIETQERAYKGMLASVLYIIISGIFEASLSPDFYGTFIILLFISISVLFLNTAN